MSDYRTEMTRVIDAAFDLTHGEGAAERAKMREIVRTEGMSHPACAWCKATPPFTELTGCNLCGLLICTARECGDAMTCRRCLLLLHICQRFEIHLGGMVAKASRALILLAREPIE